MINDEFTGLLPAIVPTNYVPIERSETLSVWKPMDANELWDTRLLRND